MLNIYKHVGLVSLKVKWLEPKLISSNQVVAILI